MTYNLIHHSSTLAKARPSSVLEDHNAVIDSALKSWKKFLQNDDYASEELVYLLDRQYYKAGFGLGILKDKDKVQALHLHDACKRHGFLLFLAHFEHSRTNNGDDDDDDESDGWNLTKLGDDDDDESDGWNLTKLFTPDGVYIGQDAEIEKAAIVQRNPFEGEDPEYEESEGWPGDEDATCTEYYRRSCLVVVPEKQYSSFLSRASPIKLREWTNALLLRRDDSTQAAAARAELLQICSLSEG